MEKLKWRRCRKRNRGNACAIHGDFIWSEYGSVMRAHHRDCPDELRIDGRMPDRLSFSHDADWDARAVKLLGAPNAFAADAMIEVPKLLFATNKL
jgi:hypothetical protein